MSKHFQDYFQLHMWLKCHHLGLLLGNDLLPTTIQTIYKDV